MLLVLGVWWALKSGHPEQQPNVGIWVRSYIAAGIITTALFGLIKVAGVALGWIRWPAQVWLPFAVDIGDDILAAAWLLATLCLWFVLRQRWIRRYEQERLRDQGQSWPKGTAPGVPIETKESAAPDRKQFYALLGMAAWVSFAAIYVWWPETYSGPGLVVPLEPSAPDVYDARWFSFFALSTPGLAFGSVLFWWFRKEK